MKIYLDDIRNPSDNSWTVVRSYQEFVDLVDSTTHIITHISFDHDLGIDDNGDELTGMNAAGYFINKSLDNKDLASGLKFVNVHSANPVGVENIKGIFKSARKYGIFNDTLEIT